MDFELTEDQRMLVDTAAGFAKKQSPVTRVRKLRDDPRGWEPAMWRHMGELGWLSVPFPEDVGGYGGRFLDAALIIEKLGTTLVPEPYVASVIVAGGAIARAGSRDQMRALLEPMIAGESSLALAWAEPGGRYDPAHVATRAARAGGGWRLDGRKVWVDNGHAADVIVVSARVSARVSTSGGDVRDPDGVRLFAIPADTAGLTRRPVATLDGRRAAMIDLAGVEVGDDALLGPDADATPIVEAALDLGAAAACAEAVGIAESVLHMTGEYLRTREQFGTAIGAFQVLQHRAVDMFIQLELMRSMSILASVRADDPDPDARREAVSAAMVQLATGGRYVVREGIQLHGGIGCTDEHDVGLYFKRMQVLSALYGDDEHHVARFASLPGFAAGIGDGGGDGRPAANAKGA